MSDQLPDALQHLFQNNRQWAQSMLEKNPNFFKQLESQQTPQYLWIGCSDSRVPANEIVNLAPGELFVHRNIANVVVHTDLNLLSVLQFATEVLGVKHVMVVGHYGCSGVHAALSGRRVGLADNWLRHVQDVSNKHGAYLGQVLEPRDRHDRMCELNVIEQVVNVCQTTIVQDAWERGQELTVHGWVYSLKDGLLRDQGMTISAADQLQDAMKDCFARYEAVL